MTAPSAHTPVDLRRLADRLRLASVPTRAHLLLLLADGERHFAILNAEMACTRAALNHDLLMLRAAHLVESRRDGQQAVYSLTAAGRDLARGIARVGGGDG
jgi:DNA-binding transcriptional ArsR family regulator